MQQKYISDLIEYLENIKKEEGDLELYKMFNEPIFCLGDLASLNEELECLEFNVV